MGKITELYLALLTTGEHVVFSIENDYDGSAGISEKKKRIVNGLNKKLGIDLIVSVKFYGYADADIKHQYAGKNFGAL